MALALICQKNITHNLLIKAGLPIFEVVLDTLNKPFFSLYHNITKHRATQRTFGVY